MSFRSRLIAETLSGWRSDAQARLIYLYAYVVSKTATISWQWHVSPSGTLFLCWHEYSLVAALSFIATNRANMPCVVGLLNNRGEALRKVYERFGGNFLQVTDRQKGRKVGVGRYDILQYLHEKGSCLLTPDGPRGPMHVIKAGARYLIEDPGVTPIWLTFDVSRLVWIPRWDRLVVPLPFCVITVTESTDMDERKDGNF